MSQIRLQQSRQEMGQPSSVTEARTNRTRSFGGRVKRLAGAGHRGHDSGAMAARTKRGCRTVANRKRPNGAMQQENAQRGRSREQGKQSGDPAKHLASKYVGCGQGRQSLGSVRPRVLRVSAARTPRRRLGTGTGLRYRPHNFRKGINCRATCGECGQFHSPGHAQCCRNCARHWQHG